MLYNTLYYVYSGIYFSDTIFGPRLRCIKIAFPSKSVQNLCSVFVQVSKCRTLKKRNYFCSLSLIHHNNGKVVVYKNSGFWFVGNKAILKLCLRMFLLKLCIFQFLQQHTYFHICHKINQIVTFDAKFHFWQDFIKFISCRSNIPNTYFMYCIPYIYFLYQANQQKYCLSHLSFHTDAKSEIYLKIACLI